METEQITACLSRYLWQVIVRGHLGEDRIKDAKIKTECFVQEDVVQYLVKHQQCLSCFIFSTAAVS